MHGKCLVGLYIGGMDIPDIVVQICCLEIKHVVM